MGQVEKVIELAQQLAEETPGFFEVKGAGVGDRATNAFMVELRKRAAATLGEDLAERCICGENNLAVDFFFPEEAAVLEVAFSLRNPASEFERDGNVSTLLRHLCAGFSVAPPHSQQPL
jgi:hypothetical protein